MEYLNIKHSQLGYYTSWDAVGRVDRGQDLAHILSDIERLEGHEQRIHEQHAHTVEIRGKRIMLHPTAEYTAVIPRMNIKLRLGMRYIGASLRDNIALVRVYNPPRLPYSNGNTAPVTAYNLRLGTSHAFSAFTGDKERVGMLCSKARE